ncbi:MAG TPA: hypothetical protein DEQ43_17370 [Nocardioides bacterium]|uniref:discoidin domain-containing protein n=1 Tax=uncultured Nocardioides sp. TaxID=198441 RepID=UPI000EF055B8|nr:hypothetical protein [uncultured Nocardioides sp.]HCB05987.1 hypothetical protein [Nocardioides sp.]
MSSCTSCGHQLGVGRFCTNCGAPVEASAPAGRRLGQVSGADSGPGGSPDAAADGGDTMTADSAPPLAPDDWRTDTAERPQLRSSTDPRTPPAAVAPPPPPRYPLYADEASAYTAYESGDSAVYDALGPDSAEPAAIAEPGAAPRADLDYDDEYYHYDEERRSPVLWILIAALVLVLVAGGWWFLVRDDGGGAGADGTNSPPSGGSSTVAQDGVDVAGQASAKAPSTAPPNEDVNGAQVSYDASNMLDGVPDTAWRTAGDATGMSLTFTLREPTELHRVGLINGYAKTSTDDQNRSFDWYLGNRRVNAVVWRFDDGTKVRQQLSESRELQMIDIDDVVTSTVVVKLVRVSPPGDGTASRNYTAISEVSLVGEPTG